MKWTLLIGILGLAIGFFVGRSQERVLENEERGVVVKSERRAGSRGGRSREGRVAGGGRSRAERMVREAGLSGEEMTEISQARLLKWILELEAGDFPEVLERLRELKGEQNADPFREGPASRDYLTVAMARWYELEGAMVLDWAFAEPEPEALAGMPKGELLLAMMVDGYENDPSLSFQLMKKHAGALRVADFGTSWCYQIGRWSRDFAVEYEEVERLATELGFNFESVDADPFADGSARPGPALIRGMLDAGREQEAREFFSQKDPELLAELDTILNDQRAAQLKEDGWQAIKTAIDRGDISGATRHANSVLNDWAREDPEKAVAWFLDQRADAADRAESIRSAALSPAFYTEGDQVFSYNRNTDGIIDFLEQMDARGEPTDEAWGAFTELLGEHEQWSDLQKLRSRVSPIHWMTALNRVEQVAVETGFVQFWSGSSIEFRTVKANQVELLDYFGIKETVMESATRSNAKALRELQEKLGVEME